MTTALPNAATKATLDAGTDDPSMSRTELADFVDKFNTMRSYLLDLFGSDGTKATAQSTLGIGTAGLLNVGDGLETSTSNLRVKLDGASLARSSSGMKVASGGVGLTEMASSNIGELLTYTTGGAPAHLSPGTSGYFLKSNGPGAALTYAAVTSQGLKRVTSYTTPGSYTWTKDSDVSFVIVLIVGGGGGGTASPTSAHGGGAAAVLMATSVSANVTVTVGAGATGATYPNSAGAGGSSSFGSYAAAAGGGGGNQSLGDGPGGIPSLGSNVTVLSAATGNPAYGSYDPGTNGAAVLQGTSGFFMGAVGADNTSGGTGTGYGGGGGAGSGGTGQKGGDGSGGCVIVYEFR